MSATLTATRRRDRAGGDGPVPLRPLSGEALTALTTEHYTLQSARAGTTHESNGRASLYFASVAGGVVALAFVAESTGTSSPAARLFAATVLAALVLLGLVTHQRLVHLAVEDAFLARAIARIRAAYLDTAPEIAPYLLLQSTDDRDVALHNSGTRHSAAHHLSHMAVMVAVVLAAVVGTATAMAAEAAGAGLTGAAVVGTGAALTSAAALQLRQVRAWSR